LPTQEDEKSAKFEADLAEQEARHLREENDNLKSTRQLREESARRTYHYLVCLSLGVFTILILDGFKFWGFSLQNQILITLSGGTFASAIGLVAIVVKGLFPNHSSGEPKARKARKKQPDSENADTE
jgi:hypothetical protein